MLKMSHTISLLPIRDRVQNYEVTRLFILLCMKKNSFFYDIRKDHFEVHQNSILYVFYLFHF